MPTQNRGALISPRALRNSSSAHLGRASRVDAVAFHASFRLWPWSKEAWRRSCLTVLARSFWLVRHQASAAAGRAALRRTVRVSAAASCSEVSHDAAAGECHWHFSWPSPRLAPMLLELSDPQACTSRPRHRGLARSERAERHCVERHAMRFSTGLRSACHPSSEREEAARPESSARLIPNVFSVPPKCHSCADKPAVRTEAEFRFR